MSANGLRLRSARTRGSEEGSLVGPERSAKRAVEGPWRIAALALLLAACSPAAPTTTIDGSSPAIFAATTAQARQDLPQADKLEFDRALASLPTRRFGAQDPEALRRTTFDGLTAAQVVEDFRQRQ